MNFSLMGKSLNEDSYEEYIDKVVNIFRLSSKDSSILFDLKIKDYKAMIHLSIVNHNGERKEFSDVVLKCDYAFYLDFLKPLVEKVVQNVDISVKDIVNLDEDELVAFRMVTNNNDLFTIDGLSEDDANSLLRLTENDYSAPVLTDVSNNEGSGNIWIFLIMVSLFAISFILIVKLLG